MTLQEVCSNVSKEGIIPLLSKFDMVSVKTPSQDYFCYFVSDGTILAYPGEKGFSSFLESFGDTRDQGTPLREFNRKIAQEVMIIAPDEEEKVVFKHAYHDAEKVDDTKEAETILSLLLSAKEQFAGFQDKEQWMKKMKLKGNAEDWAPMVSSSALVAPLSIASLDLSFLREEAEISDPSVAAALKRNKRKETTVFLAYIFICPIPIGEQYPFAQVIYDRTHASMVDAIIVEDYGKEHATFVDHMLSVCGKDGVPSAIHCQDEWSYHLYRKIGDAIGTMVVLDEKADETMDKVAESFVHALAGIVHDSVAHHDHDGCDCDHEHHD